jgi:hypothetical protein
MFSSSVTLDSHSGSVVVQSYQCSLFFITFCSFLNKISEVVGPTMKNKANVEIEFINQLISNCCHFMEPLNAD